MRYTHIAGDGNTSLYELLSGKIPQAVCGRKGLCGKCRVRFEGGAPEPSAHERDVLEASEISRGVRLACFCFPLGEFRIEEFSENEDAYSVVTDFSRASEDFSISSGRPLAFSSDAMKNGAGFGVAVDIGTTTIAMSLLDLSTSCVVETVSMMNSQRSAGADVLSRIDKACSGGARGLQVSVLRDLEAGFSLLLKKTGSNAGSITKMYAAGNTVMCHLFLGLPACSLGTSPFKPHSLRFDPIPFASLAREESGMPSGNLEFPVAVLPCADAFVGSDVIAGAAAAGVLSGPLPALYIDLGTNAEMVLFDGGKAWCSSAAAGPAFEGSHVSCGCGSLPGAVSSVALQGTRFEYACIPRPSVESSGARAEESGNACPGLCGTGLIDFLSCALEAGLVRPDGSLARICENSGVILDPALPFRLTAADVRELQLAIAAVRAGIMILLEKASLPANRINTVYLAGGFGFFLSERSAIRSGLLDSVFAGKMRALGNASLGACIECFRDPSLAGRIDGILESCESVLLAAEPGFNRYFIDCMEFPDE